MASKTSDSGGEAHASRRQIDKTILNTDTPNRSRRSFLGFLIKAPAIPAAVIACREVAAAMPRRVLLNDFKIAGFQYYGGPTHLPALAAGARLTLRPQPTNPHDAFAVEIFHGPVKLGYVPRYCNRHLSRMLLDGVALECQADTIAPNAAPWDAVAVNVYLAQVEPQSASACQIPASPASD